MPVSRSLLLETAAPFHAPAARAFLLAHAVPGRDEIRPDALTPSSHALDVPGGVAVATVAWAGIVEQAGVASIPVALSLPAADSTATAIDESAAVAVLRRTLDLDARPGLIGDALSRDPRLGPLLEARPGLRLPRARNPQEFALGTVLGQQVSLAAARTLQGRLAAAFAMPADAAVPGFVGAPDVSAIAAMPTDELRGLLGLTNARAETLRTVAAALAAGLDLDDAADHALVRSELLALRGIGPWSVEVIALRVLGDGDAFPAGDLILRRALGAASDREARALAEAWRPYRGYATQHLWADFLEAQASPRHSA